MTASANNAPGNGGVGTGVPTRPGTAGGNINSGGLVSSSYAKNS